MANFNTYPSYGIDGKILLLQNILAEKLGWPDMDFYGRVYKNRSDDGKSYVPQVYKERGEYRPVAYNDIRAGMIFFTDADDHTTKAANLFSVKVKAVAVVNLEKIFPEQSGYRNDLLAQSKLHKLVESTRLIEITGIEKTVKKVFSDFEVKGLEKLDQHPMHTFAITGTLNYYANQY